MISTQRTRQIAAVLVVVLVLVAVWAAYGIYAEFHLTGGTPSGPVLATYAQDSNSAFAASLNPSYLYNNSTEIYGGNVTLFTPITKWVNVTIVSSLETNRTAAISLQELFSVILSTSVWSKVLFSSGNASSVAAGTAVTIETKYDVSVSAVVALAALINSQLDYQSTTYTLTLDPFFSGSVTIPGQQQPMSFEPKVNFTFASSLITPSGLTYTSAGEMVAPSTSSDVNTLAGTVAVCIFAGALAGVAPSAWLATRRDEEEALPPLDQLLAPYEEAIATTDAVPPSAAPTEVAAFSDLVKIADTLGKPILRPTADDPNRPRLYVVDGTTVYRYTYSSSAGPGPSAGPSRPLPAQRRKRPLSRSAARLFRELQREVVRFRGLSLDDRTTLEAVRRARRAATLLEEDRETEAETEIVELARLLSRAVEVPHRRHTR